MALIKDKFETVAAATITLGGIATNAGRVSTQIDNTSIRAPLLVVYWKIRAGGTAPTAGTPYKLYVARSDADATTPHNDDGLGTSDAAVSVEPRFAELIDVMPAVATIGQDHYGSAVVQTPGPKFSLVFWNGTNQTIDADNGDHYVRYILVTPETV